MGVIRYKIWRDLWANKARTVQVVLIIAIGAFAIGMIITTRNLLVAGMRDSWVDSAPAMIGMIAAPGVDDETIRVLERVNGVAEVEGAGTGTVQWRLHEGDEWQAANLSMRAGYERQRFFKVTLLSGRWPDDDKSLVLGQGTDTVYGARVGESVTLRVDGRGRPFTVVGVVNDPLAMPPSFGGPGSFFVTRDAYARVFGTRDFNQIYAAAPVFDEAAVTAVANRLRDKLEKQGVDTYGFMPPDQSRIADPDKHFFQDSMDGIFLVLGVMAALALGLGLLLVYNTISAVIAGQVDQIGIMKAIGANSRQVLAIYLLYVLAFGLLALILAVPLGALAGWSLNVFLMNTFNAEPAAFSVSPAAIVAQVVIALAAPLLVAIVPVMSGARVTVREAINTYGLGTSASWLDRRLARLRHVSRLPLLMVSNTFRHKGRVALTQIALVFSGLIFMMVMSVRDSTEYTFNELLFTILNSDINLLFENGQRIETAEALALAHPDVQAAEMWGFGSGTVHAQTVAGSDDDPAVTMLGLIPGTELYGYQLRDGRWLAEGDGYTAVMNQELAQDLGVGVGDWVTVDEGVQGESEWQVVGLVFDPLLGNSMQVPRATLLREHVQVGRANTLWIKLKPGAEVRDQEIVKELRQLFTDHGMDVAPGGALAGQDTSTEVVMGINTQFRSIVVLLATMAVLIGMVGSISLSGVLSLNVIERGREIGVMRAIGAPSADIIRLFMGEGLILGWLSWLIALPLSVPAGRLMTGALSAALGSEIVYRYTPLGAALWLAIVTVLAALAGWLPARRAARISVRESLTYQ
jgi:putative ABC transport system permease protein